MWYVVYVCGYRQGYVKSSSVFGIGGAILPIWLHATRPIVAEQVCRQ